MSSITRINNLKNDFTSSEKRIADFIIANVDRVYNSTASTLASLTNTSPASIVRFSQKLGYEGFQELKIALAREVHQNVFDEDKIYEKITIHDSMNSIVNKIAAENINAIKNTIKLVDEKVLTEAIEAISSARRINIYGVGGSSLVAQDFQYKLVRIDMPAYIHTDNHLQLVSAANITNRDVAIAFSHSGKTIETYRAMEISKQRGAKTISITKFGKSPISDLADIKIYTTEVEKTLRMGAIASRIAQLTIVDILFIGIVKNNFSNIPVYIQQTSDILREFKIDK
ncbi:MAG: MurR/RpiR family transcriptional regulator [Maledivibacter sp.]|jgi:DNA-binding MurR/RpiR family transcriptional regulator|nr:MurR/RpiR family transcriptional regulator [Maledivibacter sp.]